MPPESNETSTSHSYPINDTSASSPLQFIEGQKVNLKEKSLVQSKELFTKVPQSRVNEPFPTIDMDKGVMTILYAEVSLL